ncbi:hypothetical protein RvY_11129 [Ramazzottius varieornatus]|uniref:Uncharacterized protein n=1 Tax=Ramazzottius varieornatus TaxID=947166 RepID=A0A1D1VF60_RAMVA|nr:hypothetical protein RvY_11129 [Ramazzottius varieornatus]
MYKHIFLTLVISILTVENEGKLLRGKRQTFFNFNPIISPEFFQYNGLVPITSSQINAARCQALAGRAASAGCIWLPVIVDSSGLPLSCQEQCNGDVVAPFQLQPVIGQFGPPLTPDYLTNNQFSLSDFSSLGGPNAFAGESLFVFTPPTTTTTTTSAPLTTTTTTAGTATVPSTISVQTVTTTTAPTTTVDPDAILELCIAAGRKPDTNCTFNGEGTAGSGKTLACGQICPQEPSISGPCDSSVGSHIERCLCVNKLPGNGCAYRTTGSDNPLTCPKICEALPFQIG